MLCAADQTDGQHQRHDGDRDGQHDPLNAELRGKVGELIQLFLELSEYVRLVQEADKVPEHSQDCYEHRHDGWQQSKEPGSQRVQPISYLPALVMWVASKLQPGIQL